MNIKSIWDSRKSKGFTLVELLVVIAIIGILATLVLLQLGNARAKSRDTQRIATVNQVRSAVEQYYSDNNIYPVAATWSALCTALTAPVRYLTSCPTTGAGGQLSGLQYGHNPAAAPTVFQVSAVLETRSSALDADADINAAAWGQAGVNGGGEVAAGLACTATGCYYDQGVQ